MPRKRTENSKRVMLALSVLGIVFLGFLLIKGIQYLPVFYELLFKKEIDLKTTTPQDESISVLLLGIGGGKHDGPLLTDTIIYAKIDPETKKVTMVTLPRDLWVPDMRQKINSAYAYGEQRQDGGGLLLAKKYVSKIIGQDVDYGFRIDFNGFIKAVDKIGGLDIDVDRTFDDYEYPLSGKENETCGFEGEEFEKRATASAEEQLEAFPCRYEHLHFEQGVQHMDGETALKYVRSRHALGPEGTDFARSKRQEKVIDAFKDKIFSAGTFLNPIKLIELFTIFQDSIDTDIKQNEYDDFVKLANKMRGATTQSYVIDAGDEQAQRNGLLINPPITDAVGNQWVLIPRVGSNNYSEIHAFVKCLVESESSESCTVTPTETP